jgi:ABC-2 type transport system permease protein
MWERIRVILRKEFIQALREPRMRVLLFVPPLTQLLIFGFAVNLDVDRARIAWMDMDATPASRELRDRFTGSGRFEIVAAPENEVQVQSVMDRGEAQAVIRVLPGFARSLLTGRAAEVQILVDGTNSNTASIVSNYAGGVIAGFSADRFQGAGPQIQAASRVWFNPDLYSRNYFVPGVIANIVMMITLMLTSLAIVREKEIGTMEQLMVTPVRPIELMLGKTLPFAIVGLIDVMTITGLALLVFRVPFRGNFLLLLACAALFLMTSLGAGLFISTISRTQQQAMMSSFFFSMPAFMLSGFAFPIRNMPLPVQWLTYLNPVRYFMEIVRGIFLKGAGADVLWPQMACLAVYGVAVLGLSAARFHKNLD